MSLVHANNGYLQTTAGLQATPGYLLNQVSMPSEAYPLCHIPCMSPPCLCCSQTLRQPCICLSPASVPVSQFRIHSQCHELACVCRLSWLVMHGLLTFTAHDPWHADSIVCWFQSHAACPSHADRLPAFVCAHPLRIVVYSLQYRSGQVHCKRPCLLVFSVNFGQVLLL